MSKSNGRHPGRGAKSRIPQQLRDVRAWCAWEMREVKGKPRKVPIHPDGHNFSTRKHAPYYLKDVEGFGDGVGLVLTGGVEIDGRRLLGFDCDGCRDPITGAIAPWADELRAHHKNSYTEFTPGGQGIRVLALVDKPPEGELRKVRNLDGAENTTKRPEIETFGLGRACYITVSGDALPGSSPEIETVRSLEWFTNHYPSATLDDSSAAELPSGSGAVPALDEIDRLVKAHPEGRALVAGKWEEVVPEESASEGYYRLVQRVVRAAHGHGEESVEYLLERTAYGRGTVDSAEPDRYRREGWVGTEVARVSQKAPRSSSDVFDAPATESSYMPTEAALEATLEARAKAELGAILQVDDFINEVAGREWLVDELFPSDGLASVFGKPGQGKTPVVLRLAIATAAKLPTFFGRRMEEHGPVVYFVGEDEAGVRDRVLAQLNEIDPLLLGTGLPLYLTREPASITDPANVAVWIKRILAVTGGVPPRLVIVDTLARNFGTGNESSTEDMQAYVDGCDALSRALGRCLVVCTHHPSKGNEEAGRGSGVLLGALDTEIKVELVGRTKLVATPTKIKGGPLPEEPLVGTLVPVRHGLGEKRDGSPRSAITLDDTPPDPGRVFAEVTGDATTLELLQVIGELDGPISRSALAAKINVSSKVLLRLEATLKGAGLVHVAKGAGARSPLTYHLTAQGSRAITAGRRAFALAEGKEPLPEGPGQSKGKEGKEASK